MTYCLKSSTVCCEFMAQLNHRGTATQRKSKTRADFSFVFSVSLCLCGSCSKDNFRPHAASGVDFKEQRVPQSRVNHVRFPGAVGQAFQTGFYLGNHAFVDVAASVEATAAGRVGRA